MKVDYLNFKSQWHSEKKKLLRIIDGVFSSGEYVGVNCKHVLKFEKNISKYLKIRHTVSLNSGTDALTLALHAVGIKKGDEVITPSNSFIASTGSIAHLGATPIFADVLPDQNIDPNKIKKLITNKTKAIMVVHLTGRSCNMKSIMQIAKKYKLKVIEDCAQAFGTKYQDKYCGTYGSVGCFSTHPLKNFNAMGDGGFVVTNDLKIYKNISKLRNHGLKTRDRADSVGYNSRLDNVQAAILNFRLKTIKNLFKKRRENANFYIRHLNKKYIFCPPEKKLEFNTYHLFVIQVANRDKLQKYLLKKGIVTYVHYPVPIHQQKMFKNKLPKVFLPVTESQSKKILSLPIHDGLTTKQLTYVVKAINDFYRK